MTEGSVGVVHALLLIGSANVAPLIAKSLLGPRAAWPLDFGARLGGAPLLGKSKTWRGVLSGVLAPALVAPPLGYGWQLGAAIGVSAMAGDLLSSFTKRRLQLAPSSQALGLDQIPESLFPALVCRRALGLGAGDVVFVVVLFFVLELALSKLLFRVGLRDRPY